MDDLTEQLMFARDQREPDHSRRRLARHATSGSSVRVSRGVYVESAGWASMDARVRHAARAIAVALTRRVHPVISHWSAAAIHGLPIVGPWPREVHISVPPASGGRSRNGVVKHPTRLPDEDIVQLGDVRVTSIARTMIDIAASSSFLSSVVALDRVLHVDRRGVVPAMATREEIFAAWDRTSPIRAHARVAAVIEFGEHLSDSPLESVSRVSMRVIRAPKPQLQTRYFDAQGLIGESDFSWEQQGLIGEADGDIKYLDSRFRAGRTAEQVVLDEKFREDRLRALPRKVTRWRWSTGISPARLRSHLVRAGLPIP